jgi:hypothetical protein
LKQNEHRFIRSLFEPVKEFTDSVFYDVSTWVLPMSFNIRCTGISTIREFEGVVGTEISQAPIVTGGLIASKNSYAYLFEWHEYLSPKALFEIQKAGIITRVATDKFVCDDGKLKKEFSYGSILIPATGQVLDGDDLSVLLETVAKKCGITIFGVNTGITPKGIDLGSSAFSVIQKPSILMFVGEGSNSSDAGEIWHMLDARFNMPITMVTPSRAPGIDFDRYNVIIVAGSPDVSPAVVENIKIWNRKGGTIIGYESGNNWLVRNKLADIEFVPVAEQRVKNGIYANRSGDIQVQQIPGSIFETKLDLTHPLCYGYTRDILPVFKSGATAARKDANAYNNPVVYSSNPLLSGYCTSENIARIKGTSFASVHGNRVISIYDNTNFRAIWYGTNKIFMNAIFFGQILGRGSVEYGE